jgi:hypothetical protein
MHNSHAMHTGCFRKITQGVILESFWKILSNASNSSALMQCHKFIGMLTLDV